MSARNLRSVVQRDEAANSGVLGWVVIGGLAYFVLTLALLHWLRPEVDPVARVTSEYAVGPFGFLMVSTYFVLSIVLTALVIGLARSLSTPVRSSAGLVLLLLAAVALAVAGIFPVDVGAVIPITPTGWVHRIAATVIFPSMAIGALLLSWRFQRDPAWSDLAWMGWLVGSVGLLLFAAILAFLLERGLAGAAQRVLLALIFTWIVVVAHRLISQPSPE